MASSRGWPGQTKAASGWPWGAMQVLLEDDALVALQHGFADADDAVTVADGRGHVPDLVASGLALPE